MRNFSLRSSPVNSPSSVPSQSNNAGITIMADCQDRCSNFSHLCRHVLCNMILWLFHEEMDSISPPLEYELAPSLALRLLLFESIMGRSLSLHSWWREKPYGKEGQAESPKCQVRVRSYSSHQSLSSPRWLQPWEWSQVRPAEPPSGSQPELLPSGEQLWATRVVVVHATKFWHALFFYTTIDS